MFSNIPLPNIEDITIPKQINALNELRRQNLVNKYYGHNIESEMNNRNALTEGQRITNKQLPQQLLAELNNKNSLTQEKNITNQQLPKQLALANAFQQLKNKYYGSETQAEINNKNSLTNKTNTMLPLEANELRQKNALYPELTRSQINAQNSLANYREMGGPGAGAAQKDLNSFSRQLRIDNPMQSNEDVGSYNKRINEMQSAYLSGSNKLSNGKTLPPLSGTSNEIINNIYGRNLPVAAKNQLINLDSLTEDLNSFDIDAVAAFAGPQGRAKLAYAKTNMITNPDDPNIDPMARRYLSALTQSIKNMDAMRKAYGTSVVPDYVYKTIGKMTNPNDSIFNDATQVRKTYGDVIKAITADRDRLMNKYKHGISSSSTNKEEKTSSSGKATLRYNPATRDLEEIK